MNHRLTILKWLTMGSLALPLSAQAELPFGSIEFVVPSGTVLATEQIEVRLRFTLDPASVPLNFSSDPLTGLDVADLPTEGQYFNPDTGLTETRAFASYTGAFLNTFYGCSGNFTDVCSPSTSYAFNFWLISEPGRPSINFLESFTLAPGASTEYLFGTFDPVATGALPGSYIFYNSGLTLSVRGLDAEGNFIFASGFHNLGQSCPSQDAGCAFTRTVVAIPEPASYAMLAMGLLLIGAAARRRSGTD